MNEFERLYTFALRGAGVPRRARITSHAQHVRVPREGRCVYINPRYLGKPPRVIVSHVKEMLTQAEEEVLPRRNGTKTPFIKITHNCDLCGEEADRELQGDILAERTFICGACWNSNRTDLKSAGLSRTTFPRVKAGRPR